MIKLIKIDICILMLDEKHFTKLLLYRGDRYDKLMWYKLKKYMLTLIWFLCFPHINKAGFISVCKSISFFFKFLFLWIFLFVCTNVNIYLVEKKLHKEIWFFFLFLVWFQVFSFHSRFFDSSGKEPVYLFPINVW